MTTANMQADSEKYSLPDKNQEIMTFPDRCGLRMERWTESGEEGRKAPRMQRMRDEKG